MNGKQKKESEGKVRRNLGRLLRGGRREGEPAAARRCSNTWEKRRVRGDGAGQAAWDL